MVLNKVVQLINDMTTLVVGLVEHITVYAMPFVLIYILYYLWYLDVKRVLCGSLVAVLFYYLNTHSDGKGGNYPWNRRRR